MSSHVGPEEHPSPDCSCSDTNFRDNTVQKGRTAFGSTQARAHEAPSGTFCKGHLLVKSPASPRESMWSHAEAGWFTLICCYSLVWSALHAACLTASAFLISTSPLGCCSNAGDLINLVLSKEHSHTNPCTRFEKYHTACWKLPRTESSDVPRFRFSFVCCRDFCLL